MSSLFSFDKDDAERVAAAGQFALSLSLSERAFRGVPREPWRQQLPPRCLLHHQLTPSSSSTPTPKSRRTRESSPLSWRPKREEAEQQVRPMLQPRPRRSAPPTPPAGSARRSPGSWTSVCPMRLEVGRYLEREKERNSVSNEEERTTTSTRSTTPTLIFFRPRSPPPPPFNKNSTTKQSAPASSTPPSRSSRSSFPRTRTPSAAPREAPPLPPPPCR